MKYSATVLLVSFFCCTLHAQQPKTFTATPTYDEIIATYKGFDKKFGDDTLIEIGKTDIGMPLHLYVLSKDHVLLPGDKNRKNKTVLFINNGIHPGEPDGIDASIELVKTLHEKPELLPENLVICIVPVFNVDGCINRGKYSRANQNGPDEYGFRGNAKNLDLNRDFIKCDAENTKSLERAFQQWKPEVFIDTHVSDGADYQYTMTLIATQRNKINPQVGTYIDTKFVPALYQSMKEKNYEMCPYVDTRDRTPESGIVGFLETPRFSTGYAALFNCMGFVTETHMWKPYNDRVQATYGFFRSMLVYLAKEGPEIKRVKAAADYQVQNRVYFDLNWALDTTKFDTIPFRGFEAKYKTSSISGQQRLYYDRSQPFTKTVRFYNTYKARTSALKPMWYIVPQAWTGVIERLQLNGVQMKRLKKDTTVQCEMYYIDSYETYKSSYESHYPHYNTRVRAVSQQVKFFKGDYVIETAQTGNRYIIESLEPEGDDSFFAWNFFDGILNQKEWFSDYIFEEEAEKILARDPVLKKELEEKKKNDTAFAENHWAQINFVYQRSVYKEITHNRYPVARIMEPMRLPVEK
ncbi:MAG: putative carboxypeptidase [Bacteroidetes bacterium]|nr:MAG: putative carboxypeptidase [Bacteroidota bacterium]